MKAPLHNRWSKVIVLAIVIGLAIGLPMNIWVNWQQRAASVRAEEYAHKMQPQLADDPRFNSVHIGFTSGFGAVRLTGEVSTQRDLDDLKKHINANSPNVTVIWRVDIRRSETTPSRDGLRP